MGVGAGSTPAASIIYKALKDKANSVQTLIKTKSADFYVVIPFITIYTILA